MKHLMSTGILFFVVLVLFISQPGVAQEVTLESLLKETVSLERLTVIPSPSYVTRQFSSYDRKSTDPAEPTEENWFANADRGQHLRVEENQGRQEFVLMDAEGPGAVVRFWSANPKDGGVVRIYLDNNEYPAIEMPLYVLMGGQTAPFIAPFSGEHSKGWNCYMPIPYSEHCKITISEGNIYYQINYRTYAPGTVVKTFTLAQADSAMALIRENAGLLSKPVDAVKDGDGEVNSYDVRLDAGSSDSMEFTGPAAIYRVTCNVSAENVAAALRACVVTISFDDQEGCVSAPLGDFFGTAPGVNAYQALPMGALDGGTLYSHWVMPFKEKATITLENRGQTEVQIMGEIGVVPREWTKDSLYFHAKWRCEKDIPTRPMQDWNYMTLDGQGRFAGVSLHIANPVSDWWGEGDEKIYVDGEKFPSHFGTGTEDYFGYAWCSNQIFTHAYHNQPRCDGPGNYGHTCVNRMHIMDDIPFNKSFKFDMEVWHWADTKVTQAVTAYWYAAAGGKDNFNPPSDDQLVVAEFEGVKGVDGAFEGEKLRVVSVSGGTVEEQTGIVGKRSALAQLWWRGVKPGDKLVLAFPVEKAGRYEIFGAFTKAADYGIHQIMINGQSVGDPRDFFQPDGVSVTDDELLGKFDLIAGENIFEVHALGTNPDSVGGCMFGVDYIRLGEREEIVNSPSEEPAVVEEHAEPEETEAVEETETAAE